MKLIKPKKLNLTEIHRLYLVLNHALPEKERPFLIDEVIYILDHAKEGTLVESMSILYKLKRPVEDSLEAVALFIDGLKQNDFFSYVEFIKGLDGRRNRKNQV